MDSGLMLTRDQNIVDMAIRWSGISRTPKNSCSTWPIPGHHPRGGESAMRDIIARSELAPILNRDRGVIAAELQELAVQQTLDSYEAGINVVRVNLDRADPPREVIDSFREVQAAQQERDRWKRGRRLCQPGAGRRPRRGRAPDRTRRGLPRRGREHRAG
jgi:membrane protease subunit HflK